MSEAPDDTGTSRPMMCKSLCKNPEKLMLLLFPAITLGLFLAAIVLLWVLNYVLPTLRPMLGL